MRYVLRFCVQPGFGEKEKIQGLTEYVQRAKIEEVMFFMNCEPLFSGHLSIQEYRPWLSMIAQAGKELAKVGCDWSLNPWTTLLHADRGRKKPQHFSYQEMVGPDGSACVATACPLDPSFIEYLSSLYAHFASWSPKVLWIEDDFRLHNHAPLPWGGCFCPIHMDAFSRRLGRKVDRESFVAQLCQTEGPNPVREAWLCEARDTMLGLARRVGEAVREANPRVRLGLMSSIPWVHCAEGRDWQGIMNAFATEGPAHIRPHLPAYGEINPVQYLYRFGMVSARTVASVPDGTPVFPELENAPYSTFSKSDSMTMLQIELCAAIGAEGVTMNIVDMVGNGVNPNEDLELSLAGRKAYLQSVSRLGFGLQGHIGVKSLFDPNSSHTLHAPKGVDPSVLYPHEDGFAGMLPVFGVSAMPQKADADIHGQVIGLCGQILRNFAPAQIERIFAQNAVIADGECVMTLLDSGLGRLIGAKSAKRIAANSGLNAYEQAAEGRTYGGHHLGRMDCQSDEYISVEYEDGADVRSVVYDAWGNVTGNGFVRTGNAWILPYVLGAAVPIAQLNHVRQSMVQEMAEETGIPHVRGGAGAALYAYPNGFLVANACQDDAHGLTALLPGREGCGLYEILEDGQKSAAMRVDEQGTFALPGKTLRMSTRAFVFE